MFNHQAVNEVLARWGVIPLNSPAYYAPYNGAIEQGIKELKQEMARALPVPDSWNVAQVGSFVAVAAAQRNYQPRRCLGGANAKDIYNRKQRRGRRNPWPGSLALPARPCLILKTRPASRQSAWGHF